MSYWDDDDSYMEVRVIMDDEDGLLITVYDPDGYDGSGGWSAHFFD